MSYYPLPPYRERAAFHREFWQALAAYFRRKAQRVDIGEA